MESKILVFPPPAVVMPPHWKCGSHDGSPAHVWTPRQNRPGDRCVCGTCALPFSTWRVLLPTAHDAELEASAI